MLPQLALEVLRRFPDLPNDVSRLVAVSGAPGLGKTTCCRWLAEYLTETVYPSRHLRLDHFMLPRELRHRSGKLGGGADSFRWQELLDAVRAAYCGTSLSYIPFSQRTGVLTKRRRHWRSGHALVWVDGTLSLHDDVLPFTALRVFFDASDEWCWEARLRAETKRGYSRREATRRFEANWREYVEKVAPLRAVADIVVWCEPGYRRSVWTADSAPDPRSLTSR